MRVSRWIVRLSVLALAAVALGACASQPHDKVDVSVGMEMPARTQAKDYAALYLPYAMMATAAYTNTLNLNEHRCPDRERLRIPAEGESAADAEFRGTVRGWIAELNARGWSCYSGVNGSLPCPRRLQPDCTPVGGLEFHIWRRMTGSRCAEVAIAFRGTDRNDLGDWISNFRWFNRLVPKFDQYAQVQDHITRIVRRAKHGCASAQFVSAGHSLGGGLAQQAAYADNERSIRYVYAFDPSPVTGYFDVSEWLREHNTEGLGVDRAYEQGEILTLPRLIIENIFPPAECNPRIRSVRFNLLTGLPVSQHSIAGLTAQLHAEAKKPGANPKHVEDVMKAQSCKGGPLLPLPVHIQSPA